MNPGAIWCEARVFKKFTFIKSKFDKNSLYWLGLHKISICQNCSRLFYYRFTAFESPSRFYKQQNPLRADRSKRIFPLPITIKNGGEFAARFYPAFLFLYLSIQFQRKLNIKHIFRGINSAIYQLFYF